MTAPGHFLQALARAATAINLYDRDHPSARRAIDAAFASLRGMKGTLSFTFNSDEVRCGTVSIPDLRRWVWARRLMDMGLRRLEIREGVTRDELTGLLDELAARLGQGAGDGTRGPLPVWSHIRAGDLDLPADTQTATDPAAAGDALPLSLTAERRALLCVHEAVLSGQPMPCADARVIVSSVRVAMLNSGAAVVLQLGGHTAEDRASHAVNVSALAMAFSDALGADEGETLEVGLAGLLYGIGEVLDDGERCTPAVAGARLLLRADDSFQLAAVVASEHGGLGEDAGAPFGRFTRDLHWATRLVQVCTIFERLQAASPGSSSRDLLSRLAREAGTPLDQSMLQRFIELMARSEVRRLEERTTDAPEARRA